MEYNKKIKCPYCGYEDEDEEYNYHKSGIEEEKECDLCQETFFVYVQYERYFSTYKKE